MLCLWTPASRLKISCGQKNVQQVVRFALQTDTLRARPSQDYINPTAHRSATLYCHLMVSNYANRCLVLILCRSRSGCWPFLGLLGW